jgi:hypothetical protein
MGSIRLMIVVSSIVVFAGTAAAQSSGGGPFIKPDLSNWEGLTEYWSFKDGAVVGATPKGLKFNTFLCSKKQYGDFEMSFQVRLKDAAGNSGVQIRSKIINPDTYAVSGPQCDMGAIYWGSLYGEAFGGMMKQAPEDVVQKALKPKDFNDYSIRCVGDHVTIKLNGQVTVDDDFPKMPKQGIIAFQLHAGGPMEVTFRNIRFKELQGGKRKPEKLPTPKETAPAAKTPSLSPAKPGPTPAARKSTSAPARTAKAPFPPAEVPAPAPQRPAASNLPPSDDEDIYEMPTRRGLLLRLFQRLRR